ncbi:MAG TPA: fibronectin type III domain-containing protein [Anaeromyxobacteraceae bacterium]|nr:fibronectin type III domain-containing protein [Anaeromyxobacteraceae bacterium]
MKSFRRLLTMFASISLFACGSSSDTAPGAPTEVSVAAGTTAGTAVVSFNPPASSGSSAITGYTVTANPGGITATGTSSPITVSGLAPKTAYTYSVTASNAHGGSAAATTGALSFYSVVETFYEPMTQPNNTIFTGAFTYDATNKAVSNLTGSLTEAMSMSTPMTTVSLTHQLSATPVTLGGQAGLLVTAFFLNTTNTFDPSGFAPGGTEYYGLSTGAKNPSQGGVGNAYAMIFVDTADPTTALVQAQIDKLAYADCTAGGMMGSTCMTGTATAGYGKDGTMMGHPQSQVTTKQ